MNKAIIQSSDQVLRNTDTCFYRVENIVSRLEETECLQNSNDVKICIIEEFLIVRE